MAAARKIGSVRREIRWRWTLKVLYAAACMETKRWAEPGDLNHCIFRSLRRTGWCETSARLFLRSPCSCRAERPISAKAAP